jgi:hypothetical protein
MHRSYALSVGLTLIVAAAGCHSAGDPQPEPAVRVVLGIQGFDVEAFSMLRGGEEQLTVAAFDAAGRSVPATEATLISRAPDVASVNETAFVRALEPGRTWIVVSILSEGMELRDSIEVLVRVSLTP